MRASPILQKAIRRLPLSTKQAGKGYYKGNRTGAMGRHTKYGGYILDPKKMRTFLVPDLVDFELTPFVDRNVKIIRDDFSSYKEGPVDGLVLIDMWKANGGEEIPEQPVTYYDAGAEPEAFEDAVSRGELVSMELDESRKETGETSREVNESPKEADRHPKEPVQR